MCLFLTMTVVNPLLFVACAIALSKPTFAIFDSKISSSSRNLETTLQNGVWMTTLSNNQRIPLVGFGAGNVARSHVGALTAEAIQPDKKIYLIDTAQESRNEALIAEGILAGVQRFREDDVKPEVHIVTKVWYTHLGYNRTRLAVEDSLEALRDALESDKVDIKLHIQLHWPRCFESIDWMHCDNEEANLEEKFKQVGPDPRQDPANSLKGSWKYLEDLYLSATFPVASIGVSNFALADLEELHQFARVQPFTLQVNLWSVLNDPVLVEHCRRNNIHIQVYNVLQSAMGSLQDVVKAVPSMKITPGQSVMSWLIAQNFSVFPRTSKMGRLSENSGATIASLPPLSPEQMENIGIALRRSIGEGDILPAEELPVAQSIDAFSWFLALSFLLLLGVATREPSLSSPPLKLKLKQNFGARKRLKQKGKKTAASEEKRHVGNRSPGWSFAYLWKIGTLSSAGHPYSDKIE